MCHCGLIFFNKMTLICRFRCIFLWTLHEILNRMFDSSIYIDLNFTPFPPNYVTRRKRWEIILLTTVIWRIACIIQRSTWAKLFNHGEVTLVLGGVPRDPNHFQIFLKLTFMRAAMLRTLRWLTNSCIVIFVYFLYNYNRPRRVHRWVWLHDIAACIDDQYTWEVDTWPISLTAQ